MPLKFKTFEAYNIIKENFDSFIQEIDSPNIDQIKDFVNQQDDILNKYDLPKEELDKVRDSIKNTIRTQIGFSEF